MTHDRRNKYNLDKYTDGGQYTLSEGEDFHTSHRTFRTHLLNYARRHNLFAKTKLNWYPNQVTFRFYKTLRDLERSGPLVHAEHIYNGLPNCVVCGAQLTGLASDVDLRCRVTVNGQIVEKHEEFR
jgi:hypothetical protein